MAKFIMVGCDLHDRSMLIRYAIDTAEPQQLSFENNSAGRGQMISRLKALSKKHDSARIVFAYEASGLGFGLADQLIDEGIECHVLSPTLLPKTPKSAKLKTDSKDAQMLLEQVRGWTLAGNHLPIVWTPPQRLRDDRELVRARVDAAEELTRVKLKILSMLKRREIQKPASYHCKWSKAFVAWLRDVIESLDVAVGPVLERLVDRFELYKKEIGKLDKALRELANEPRYRAAHRELRNIPGVGLVVAMSFLTEMGDLLRFENRRQVGAYLGLCPTAYESGEANDRKGRITRQGPSRLRKLLCQAAWVSVRHCPDAAASYERIKQGQKKRTKKATVALMRKLAIKMWHRAMSCGVNSELQGRGGPRESIDSVAQAA